MFNNLCRTGSTYRPYNNFKLKTGWRYRESNTYVFAWQTCALPVQLLMLTSSLLTPYLCPDQFLYSGKLYSKQTITKNQQNGSWGSKTRPVTLLLSCAGSSSQTVIDSVVSRLSTQSRCINTTSHFNIQAIVLSVACLYRGIHPQLN